MTEPMTTTREARRATRDVVGGNRDLAILKVAARRRNRRAARQSLRMGKEIVERRVTGHDVS